MRARKWMGLIDAPAEAVWDVITDFAHYRDWNPFITALDGELHPGARLRATFSLAGHKARTFTPILTIVEPGRRLAWRGRLAIPKLFDAEHVFLPEPHATRNRLSTARRSGVRSSRCWAERSPQPTTPSSG